MHSALESIELSLGQGDIQDCFHRHVLDNEFASYFGVDTLLASELSLSLAPTWKGACWMTTLRWNSDGVCLTMGSSSSFCFVQTTNESITRRSLEPTGSRIMNDRASPATFAVAAGNRQEGAMGSNQFVFVDNLGVCGVCKASVRDKPPHACELRQARSQNP